MSQQGESQHASNNFDFLRLFFALLVVFSHSYTTAGGSDDVEPLVRVSRVLSFGSVAVEFFFITSGYLIAASWVRRPQPIDYLKRRSLRIFPGYVVATVVSLALFAPQINAAGSHVWSVLIRESLVMGALRAPGLLQANTFPDYINASVWTIRHEFTCYLILMALGLARVIRKSFALPVALAASFLIGPVSRHLPAGTHLTTGAFGAIAQFVPYFLAGATAYVFRDRIVLRLWLFVIAVAAAVIAVRLAYRQELVIELATTLCGTYCILFVGFSRLLPLHGFGKYGDFSYGTYLYAFPLQQKIDSLLPGITPLAMFTIAAPLSVLCGVASWYLVERRFLRRTRISRPIEIAPLGDVSA